jgi:hypothetical protein
MRTTKLFATFLVAGLIASACAQDPDYVLPAIKVESEELNFSAETEQALVFTATRDWRVQSKPDWVTVVPDQGSGSGTSQRVNICVAANPDYNRSGEVVLTIGLDKAHVAVIQPGAKGEVPVGSGTKEDPYTVTGVLRYIATLGADVESENDVYVTGTISAVTEAYSAQYGNATFEMTSDSGEKFTFYRGLYLGNKKWTANDTQIKVGDAVVVCGKVINFKGNTPETQQNKAYLYSLNGETQGTGGGGGGGSTGTPSGTGTQADPYNVAAARAAVANLTWTSTTDYQKTDPVYVKGKISKIADNGTYGASGTFGNATFFISDDGSTSNELEAYRILYLGNQKYTSGTDIKVGDEVIIYASLMNYRGNTPETVQSGAYLYSLNGVTEAASGGGNEGGGQGGGETTTVTYSKVTSITAGKKYVMVGVKDNKYYAATPLASDKTYGRLSGKETTVSNDKITEDMSSYEFTFASVDGGYTIAMPDGRLLGVDTEHDGTFQIGDSYDHTFTASVEGGLFKIVHKSTGKIVYHGGGTYTNFSCATTVADGGTFLQLYLKDSE